MAESESNAELDRVRYALRARGVPPEASESLRSGVHTRGYLPHVKREEASYFVTFRLADSLPQEELMEFKREHLVRNLPMDEVDYYLVPLLEMRGGRAKGRKVFSDLQDPITELNEAVAA